MKDEGPFILEWIAHHLAVGFSRIVVYTNDCSDGTDKILMRLETLGLAHHRVNLIPDGLRPQPSALNYAQNEPLVSESDWVLVFDADEFISIRYADGTLDPLLDAAEAQGANGIVITWRIFGSGGVHDWSRAPVSEQYLMAAPPDWNKGWGVKTLFKFDPEYWKLGIHRPKMKNKWVETAYPETVKWLNGSGQQMEDYFKFRGWRSITRTIGYDWVQMNHYAVKSIDSYAIRKFRGNVNLKKDKYNADYWALQDRNEVHDDTMLRYTGARNRIMDLLLTDPELNALHFAAIALAEAKLAEFKGTPAYIEMVAGLKTASQVSITEVVAKPPQARDPEKIAALMGRVEKGQTERQKAARKAAGPPPTKSAALLDAPAMVPTEGVAWVKSHDILLPVDPGFFSAQVMDQIAAGKFERGLARLLPRLLHGHSRLIELGGAPGFRSAQLSRCQPGLKQLVQESHAGRLALIREVWSRNGLAEGPELQLVSEHLTDDALQKKIVSFQPDCLIVADLQFSPEWLAATVKSYGKNLSTVIVTGQAMQFGVGWKAVFPSMAMVGADEKPADFFLARMELTN